MNHVKIAPINMLLYFLIGAFFVKKTHKHNLHMH